MNITFNTNQPPVEPQTYLVLYFIYKMIKE